MRFQVCVSFLLLIGLLQSCKETKETTKPEMKDMTVSVYASVIVQPEDLYDLFAEAPGIIQSINVEEGDTVKANQRLALIKRDNINYDVNSAIINKQLAEQNLKGQSTKLASIKSELKILQNQLALDSLNYIRQEKLWNQNIGSKNQLELYQLKFEQEKENIRALRVKYDQMKQELEASYKLSENKLNQVRSASSNYSIRAKSGGRIYELNKAAGEAISSQQPFAKIGSTNEFIVEMQIDEVDIARVKLGQDVAISLDAYSKDVFEGKLTKILPSKNIRTQTFTAEATFVDPPPSLYAGLAGEASIIISMRKDVITIPLDYLVGDDRVLDENGEEIKVVLGEKNMDQVEVISGIDSSTVIVKPGT